MSKLDKDQVISDFTAAYEAANGKAPEIEAKGGWYSVDGGKNMRLAQLAELAAELGGGDKAEAAPAEAPKAEKPAAEKKAAKKPAAKKPAAKKAAKKASGGFSVKDAWAAKIADSGRMPRGLR